MPQSILTIVGLVTGYLHGAGLGVLMLSFYPGASVKPDVELALIAALILGPAGALAGAAAARAGRFGFSSDPVSDEDQSDRSEPTAAASSSF
jgi:hypothetical protein